MNINIIAPNHENQQKLREFYTDELSKEYGKQTFLSRVDLHIKNEKDSITEVGLELFPRGGNPLYVSSKEANERKAYKSALAKMRVRIEKYKDLIVQNHKIR